MVVSHFCFLSFVLLRKPQKKSEEAPTLTEKEKNEKIKKLRVKVHGVSLSRGKSLASSRESQIRPVLG